MVSVCHPGRIFSRFKLLTVGQYLFIDLGSVQLFSSQVVTCSSVLLSCMFLIGEDRIELFS